MKSPGDVDETGAEVRRGGLCEAIKKPRAAKGGKGQMLQSLPAYGGRAAFSEQFLIENPAFVSAQEISHFVFQRQGRLCVMEVNPFFAHLPERERVPRPAPT